MPGGAGRRGWLRPRAGLRVRRLLPGGRSISLELITSRLADDRMLELSAATGEALFNSLFEATVAVTDDDTGGLNQSVSRVEG